MRLWCLLGDWLAARLGGLSSDELAAGAQWQGARRSPAPDPIFRPIGDRRILGLSHEKESARTLIRHGVEVLRKRLVAASLFCSHWLYRALPQPYNPHSAPSTESHKDLDTKKP